MTAPDRSVEYWRARVRRVRPQAPETLVDELAGHLHELWQEAREGGASVAEADARAWADLDRWRGPAGRRALRPWQGWTADLRHGSRGIRRRPAFAAAVVVLAALAIGAVTVAVAIAYGLLVRPLPYPDGDRLAVLWQVRQGEVGQVSYADFRDLAGSSFVEAASALSGGRGSLRVGDRIERVNALFVEPPALAMLGARPVRGRLLTSDDAGQPLTMVSDRLWRTHLAGDPDVVGRSIWMSGTTYTIVGVLQPGFDFELPVAGVFELEAHDLWMILDTTGPVMTRRDVTGHEALVRMRPGVSLDVAQREVDARARELADAHPATNRDRGYRVAWLHAEVVQAYRPAVLLSLTGALFALTVAAANILTLTGIRLAERRPELAVRRALGAGAFRIARQLVTEHAMLVAAGAGAGIVAADRVLAWLVASEAANLPRPDAIRLDGPVLAAAAASAVLLLVLMVTAPGRRAPVSVAGARVTAGDRRIRRWVTAGELALAVVLATGGVLFGLSLERLLSVDPGFDPAGVASARVSAYAERQPGPADVEAFFTDVVEAIGRVPGVERAAAGSSLAMSGQMSGTSVTSEDRLEPVASRPTAGWQFVTPGYFAAVGMRVVRGRDFTVDDRRRDGHVTVVNETLARTLFGDADPIGRRISVGGGDAAGDWHQIVGVVADVRHQALAVAPAARVYDLFGEHWGRTLYVVARASRGEPATYIDAIRRVVGAIDREAPVFETASLDDLVGRSAAVHRLAATIAGGLAALAMVLALVGTHAVAAVFVTERAREVGLRAALGASPRDLAGFAVREPLWTAAIGGLAGGVGAVLLVRSLAATLFGVSASAALLAVPVVVVAMAAASLAAAIPAARRAVRTDAVSVLRAS